MPRRSTSSAKVLLEVALVGESETWELRQSSCDKARAWKVVDNSQQGREKVSKVPKRHKPGKKALQAAAEMSQLLDDYVPLPSNTVILDS